MNEFHGVFEDGGRALLRAELGQFVHSGGSVPTMARPSHHRGADRF
jgi:hypothetical protein